MPRKTPFLHMTDLYHEPGKAEQSIALLAEHPEAQLLLEAGISYSRGDIDRVYKNANYLLNRRSGFYASLSAGMLLALCAIWQGDLTLWRQAKIHMAEAPVKSDEDRDIISLSIAAVDSMLYDTSSFPEWFKMGRFDLLQRAALPAVKVFYAKYLYAQGYSVATRQLELQGVQGLSAMNLVPYAIEPMISQAMADNSIVAEIYLRLTCAAVYNNSGNIPQAIYHIDRAIDLALPDKLYGLLSEYCRVLYALMEQRLNKADPEAWVQVKNLYKTYNAGWIRLSGSVRGRNLATTLTPKEREVAKLAAFGLKNGEIAEKLHMSISGVKQTITSVSTKTGMRREDFAAVL